MDGANPINPWVRANIEQADPETRQLIVDYEQPEYDAVLEEVAAAGIALNALLGLVPAAQERMTAARLAQLDFFSSQKTDGRI